jgi:hypothetical protein
MTDPIRIVIGAGPDEKVPALVLESTIRENTEAELEIIHTFDRDRPGGSAHGEATDFTYVRFWVPELCGQAGRAIYMDGNSLVFGDVAELWDLPMNGKLVLRNKTPAVLVIDCLRCFWDARAIARQVERGSMSATEAVLSLARTDPAKVGSTIQDEWVHADRYEDSRTKLLLFMDRRRRPWVDPRRHELGDLWSLALREAAVTKDKQGRMQELVEEIRAEMSEWPDDLRRFLTTEVVKRSFAGVPEDRVFQELKDSMSEDIVRLDGSKSDVQDT